MLLLQKLWLGFQISGFMFYDPALKYLWQWNTVVLFLSLLLSHKQFMHDLPPATVVKTVTPETGDIVTRVSQQSVK